MSKNINQIFLSNPASNMQNNDLLYLGRSPYSISDDMSITFDNFLNSVKEGFNSPANMLFVTTNGNDTTGDGTIIFPFATYEKARSVAVSLASSSNPYNITILGSFNIVGNLIISPFVNILGFGSTSSILNITGQVIVDSLFDSILNSVSVASNVFINAAGGINIIFTVFQFSSIRFFNCEFTGTPSFSATGAGSNSNSELIIMLSCVNINLSMPITFTNVTGVIINSSSDGGVTSINNSSTTNNTLIMQGIRGFSGNVTLTTSGSGFQFAALGSLFASGSTLTLDGTLNTLFIDSSSYNFILSLINGATLSNINNVSLSDGISANMNFTPINYIPTVGSNFQSNSVTGNLNGIDLALNNKQSFTWNIVSASTKSLLPNNGYITDNGVFLVTYTLPAICSAGSMIKIIGKSIGLWTISQLSNQQIFFDSISTTLGTGGSLSPTGQYQSILLMCITDNLEFEVIGSIGNFNLI